MNFVADIPCCIFNVLCIILICKQRFIYLSLEVKASRNLLHLHRDVLQGVSP